MLIKIIIILIKKKNEPTKGDYVFIKKSLKNEIYNTEDFVKDIKKFYKETKTMSFFILIFMLPLLIIASITQKLIQYWFIIWDITTLFLNIYTEEKLCFEPNIKLDNFNFCWKEIFIINFYDIPKANAFILIYLVLNKKLEQKNHKLLLNRVLITKTSGLSINVIKKIIWTEQLIKNVLNTVQWRRKYIKNYLSIFIEEYRQKYSIVINGSMYNIYNFTSTKTLYFDKKIILNPRYEHIIDIKDKRVFRSIYKNTLIFFQQDLENKLKPTPENLLECTNKFGIYTARLKYKPHLTVIAGQDLDIMGQKKQLVLSEIFTHSSKLKTDNQLHEKGREIIQHIDILTGEKFPDEQTYNFFSAVSKNYFENFNSLLIASDYGIRSIRDIAIFSHIENIKILKEINKVINWNEILVQTDNKRYLSNFQQLINNNKIAKESMIYIDYEIPKIKKSIEYAITTEINKTKKKLIKLQEDAIKYPLLKDKKEIFEEMEDLEKKIKEWVENEETIVTEITKAFCSQVSHEPIQSLIQIGGEYLDEIEVGVMADKIHLITLNKW